MTQPQSQSFTLDPQQLDKAHKIIDDLVNKLLNGESITDDERAKAARLYGKIVSTVFGLGGSPTDEDVVRNTAVVLLIGGVSFGDVIKFMVDCLTGNPVTAPNPLADDPDLMDDLGGTAGDPDLDDPQPQTAPQPDPSAQPQGKGKGNRFRGGGRNSGGRPAPTGGRHI